MRFLYIVSRFRNLYIRDRHQVTNILNGVEMTVGAPWKHTYTEPLYIKEHGWGEHHWELAYVCMPPN